MADIPAAGRLRPLAEVNHEPGERALSRTVAVLNTIMVPFTKRDWRSQDKIPQTRAINGDLVSAGMTLTGGPLYCGGGAPYCEEGGAE